MGPSMSGYFSSGHLRREAVAGWLIILTAMYSTRKATYPYLLVLYCWYGVHVPEVVWQGGSALPSSLMSLHSAHSNSAR